VETAAMSWKDPNLWWRLIRSIVIVVLAEIEKGNQALVVGADPSAWWTPETLGWTLQALALMDALRTAFPPLWAAFWVFVDSMRKAVPPPVPEPLLAPQVVRNDNPPAINHAMPPKLAPYRYDDADA